MRVVCPSCSNRLFITGKPDSFQEVVLPQGAEINPKEFRVEGKAEIDEEAVMKAAVRHGGATEWEYQASVGSSKDDSVKPRRWINICLVVVAALVGVGTIGYGAWILIDSDSQPAESTVPNLVAEPEPSKEISLDAAKSTPSVQEVEDLNFKQIVAAGERIADQLMAVEGVDQLIPLCYEGESMEGRIKRYYNFETLDFAKIRKVNSSSVRRFKNGFSLMCEMDDYSVKALDVIYQEGEAFLDWETWVAYSEMKPKTFMKEMPNEPVLFRVFVKPSNYYNHDFADDEVWVPFQIIFSDNETRVTGYCKRNSEVANQMNLSENSDTLVPMTLKISYPEGSAKESQVLIDEVVQTSWSQFLERLK